MASQTKIHPTTSAGETKVPSTLPQSLPQSNSSNGGSKVGPAPKCHYDEQRGIVLRYLMGPQAGKEYVIAPATLRRASRDALSVDEM